MIVSDGSGVRAWSLIAVTATARAGRTHHRTRRRESDEDRKPSVLTRWWRTTDALCLSRRPRPCPRARLPGRKLEEKSTKRYRRTTMATTIPMAARTARLADSSPPPPRTKMPPNRATKNATIPRAKLTPSGRDTRRAARRSWLCRRRRERLECRSSIEASSAIAISPPWKNGITTRKTATCRVTRYC